MVKVGQEKTPKEHFLFHNLKLQVWKILISSGEEDALGHVLS